MRGLAAANAAPRCGAHSRRTGQPCRAAAMKGRARCRMHGGRAGRKPTHGRKTNAAIQHRQEFRALMKAVRELLNTT